MNRQIRFTALLLAVCLLLNSVAFPAAAEGDLEPTQEATEVTTAPTEELTVPAEDGSAPTEEATEPAEEAFVPTEGAAEPTSRYKPEGNTLLITSSRELLLLSYLDPWEYCDLNLTFSPSVEKNAGFDLLKKEGDLQFQGLGSEEYPFRGEILFADGTGPIALNRPLFNALSDDAKITGLSLESHVQGVAEGGLLAKTVTHGQGGNTWVVTLTQPEPEENIEVNLLPLIFNLENNAEVSLDVTDLSGLPVLGSGYICAVMGENAQVTLSGIDTIPAVTGSGDAVGGLVGLMKSGASLTVMGESITVSGVTGNWNVGGIVGSATDPLLSLPSVVGCDGAVVSGVNVGGLIGRLTYMPGDHGLSVTLSSLTLEGSDNAGGLVGVLLRDAGTLTLDAQVEGIVLTEGAINCGSLFGTYYTSSPENPLILNGKPIAEEAELEALAGFVDYPGKLEIFVTVEDAQAIIDSILNAELRPGEMSPLWWAVVSGKLTAEELAAQLNAYYSGATETDPAEETEPTEESEATEPTEETQTQETDNLPQEPTPGEGDSSPETASFSLQAEDSAGVSLADEQVSAHTLTNSEEANPNSQEAGTAAPAPFNLESLLSAYAADLPSSWPENKGKYVINSSFDLVLLSYLDLNTYITGNIIFDITDGSLYDLTKTEYTNNNQTYNVSFQGLGGSNAAESFAGSVEYRNTTNATYIKLQRPLFNSLSDKATIKLLNLYSGLSESLPDPNPTALLAEKITHDSNETEFPETPWEINLRGISGRSSLPLIGTMVTGSMAKVNMSLCVGTIQTTDAGDTENSFTSIADCSSLTVRGSGYLCGTMENNAELTVNLFQNPNPYNGGDPTALCIPPVTSSGAVGGLVGTMGNGAKLTVTAASALPIKAVESADGNAGGLVGYMDEKALLSTEIDITIGAVTANVGNAGGLVGSMADGATLNSTKALTLGSVTAQNNAGGLVGEAVNPVLNLPTISGPSDTSITISGTDAGGLVGKLSISVPAPTDESAVVRNRSLLLSQSISGLTIKGNNSSGGLFGLLVNSGADFTIGVAPDATDVTVSTTLSGKIEKDSEAGGLIGTYQATALRDSLILQGLTVASTLTVNSPNYGGLIGFVSNESAPAYIHVDGATVTTNENASPVNYGGFISELGTSGNMVHVSGEVQITAKTGNSNQFTGSGSIGGIVGNMPAGVLRLETEPNLTNAVPSATDTSAKTRGWILGNRGNTLVYTDALNWNHNKSDDYPGSDTNDTGLWGQVLRFGNAPLKIETTSSEESSAATPAETPLLTFDDEAHTVTVRSITADSTTKKYSVSNERDFAALALRIQLDAIEGGALRFDGNDPIGTSISFALGNDINLENTGLACLTKDYYTANGYYAFVIDGSGHSITLPSIMVYVAGDKPENGNGAHDRQGLIGQAGKLTVNNLTLKTAGKTLEDTAGGCRVKVILSGKEPYVGMLAAEVNNTISLENFASSVKLSISSACETLAKISGIIGVVTKGNVPLTFTNCTWDGSIHDTCRGSSYTGGYLSFISTGGSRTVTATNCNVKGSIKKEVNISSSNKYVPVGPFICTLYYGTTTLIIDSLAVSGVDVTVTGTATNCGGLLSYEWGNVIATVKNVTITNSHLNTPNNCEFGGLMYKASGKIQIGDFVDSKTVPGITFNARNTIKGTSTADKPAGLLIGRGDYVDGTMKGLYLIVKEGGYVIGDPENVTIDIGNSTYFDELVGKTLNTSGNGIVSIETPVNAEGKRLIDQNRTCDTYLPKLSTQYNNKKTRYYYNLSHFSLADTTVDSPEEMVMLSAGRHCHSDLRKHFLTKTDNSSFTIGKTDESIAQIDLTGYSYYPIVVDGYVSVRNAAIKFDYATLETVEETGYKIADPENVGEFITEENRKPSNANRQHYLMHTGIFEKAENTSTEKALTLNVTNLTLRGTVGGSAIIRDKAKGNGGSAMTVLNIQGVILDGIRTQTTDGIGKVPLLIGSINNYTSLTMSGVKTNDTPTTAENGTQTYPYDDLGENFAASSLIGDVGNSSDGKNISLIFTEMGLDGRVDSTSDSSRIFGTTKSIFSDALFLKSFQYTEGATCSGIYTFTRTDDYTLGKELSNTQGTDHVGRNPDEQYWFFGENDNPNGYVYKVVDPTSTAATCFAKGYRRYVKVVEGSGTNQTFHELDINLPSPDLDDGCGTYSHPYRIKNARQLYYLAQAIASNPVPGWKINMSPTVLAGTSGNPDFSLQGNGHNVNADSGDVEYTATAGDWTYTNGQGNTATVGQDKVLAYLRNAYYILVGPDDVPGNAAGQAEGNSTAAPKVITLSAERWAGLGTSAASRAFSGVIVGGGATLVIEFGANSAAQFGGLIKYSQGSVVKGVTISYANAPRITAPTGAPTSDENARFFGGVVGWCIGGDTIIDNVTVEYNGAPTVTSDTLSYLAAIGGYVGMVGGYAPGNNNEEQLGGGVVFRGTLKPSLTSGNFAEGSTYFYWNPYVGRVLDGYAMGDGIQLDNTNKNYYIPNISAGVHLTRSGTDIHVNNGYGLWLLSSIVNSGAGHMGFADAKYRSNAYNYGKPRTKDYALVGTVLTDVSELYDEAYLGGVATAKNRCFLTSKYTTGDFSQLTILDNNYYFRIYLDGVCDVSGFKNGFRGIGCSYGANTNQEKNMRLLRVMLLDGGGNTVNLAQDRKEYLNEASSWISVGTGMFIQLCVKTLDNTKHPTFQNLTLKGSTGITYYQGTALATNDHLMTVFGNWYNSRLSQVGAGMLAATLAKNGRTQNITFSNIQLREARVNPGNGVGTTFAGGLVGVVYSFDDSNRFEAINIVDCAYSDLTVRGFVDAGGFFGRMKSNMDNSQISISYAKDTSLTGGRITSTSTSFEKTYFGYGALIGCTERYGLTIQPSESAPSATLFIDGLTAQGGYTGGNGCKALGGGLVGVCFNPQTKCTIQNVTTKGTISISGNSESVKSKRYHFLGGLIGSVADEFNNWKNSGNYSVTVSNVKIAESGSVDIQYAQQIGALFGLIKCGGEMRISNVTVGSESAPVRFGNIMENSGTNVGGLIGGGNVLKDVILDGIKIVNTKLLINGANPRGAALLFGTLENGAGTIDIRNLSMKDCIVATGSKKLPAGFVYGYLFAKDSDAPSITGNNILIENCRVGYNTALTSDVPIPEFEIPELSFDGTETGFIGGKCSSENSSIKLVGVSLRNCTAPTRYFGNTKPKSDSYVIRADYLADTSGAGLEPKVTTSPQKTFAGIPGEVLTGDGIAFSDDTGTSSIAKVILDDAAGTNDPLQNAPIHFSVTNAVSFIGENSSALSTYFISGDNGENPGPDDFPVLEIANNDINEINRLIACYISLMTDHQEYTIGTDAAKTITANYSTGIFTIQEPVTYHWNGEGWEPAQYQTMRLTTTGQLAIVAGRFDNQMNQFTLLDVAYKDAANENGQPVYHLYIPVIVKRIMQFKFWAAAENSSSHYAPHYASLNQSAIGSNKDLITTLLTFQYQWTKAEWQAAVNSGLDLLWNFDKEIIFNYNSIFQLPQDTRLTLVDCNNQDLAYYGTYNSRFVNFSSLRSLSTEAPWSCNDAPLCDRLKLTEVEYDSTGKLGKFVKCDSTDLFKTLRIENQYYRSATDADPEASWVSIQVGLGENELVEETYYLSIQTQFEPTEESVCSLLIQCSHRLKNPIDKTGLPTTWIMYDNDRDYFKNGSNLVSENRVVISNFYTQTIQVTTGNSPVVMSSENVDISGSLRADVTFLTTEGFSAFSGQKQGRELMQQFCLSLKDQAGNPVPFPADTSIQIGDKWYSVDPGYTYWLPHQDVTGWTPNDEGKQTSTVSTDFTLHFTTEGIISTFPERPTTTSMNGIQVCASSSLSLNPDALKRSNQRISGAEQNKLFYRKEMSLATLSYNAYDIAYPDQASGLSNLGINGWEGDSASIPSAAIYDASALRNTASAKKLKCTIDLLCKNLNDDGYSIVASSTGKPQSLDSFLSSITITPKVSVNGSYKSATLEDGFVFSLPSGTIEWHSPVQIEVNLGVITGEVFERSNMYSNYKVLLTVELLGEKDGNDYVLDGSHAYDYIIYTNTKIIKELIS